MGAYEDYLKQLALASADPYAPSYSPQPLASPPVDEPSFYESYVEPTLHGVGEVVGYPYRKLSEFGVERLGLQQAGEQPEFGADVVRTAGENIANVLYPSIPTPVADPEYYPVLSRVKAAAEPVAGAAYQMLTDPSMLAFAGAGKLSKVPGMVGKVARGVERGVGSAIVPGMAAGTVEAGGRAVEAAQEEGITSPEALRAGMETAVAGGFTAMGARGALRGAPKMEPKPAAGEVAPAFAAEKAPPRLPDELGFYSQLSRVADQFPQPAAKAEDWARYLSDPKRQVRADEIKWTGLDEYLVGKKGQRVTREEVQDFLDQNEVRVEETTKGGDQFVLDENGQPISDGAGGLVTRRGATKFGQWQTPGGKEKSYRELLLTLPQKRVQQELVITLRKGLEVVQAEDGTWNLNSTTGRASDRGLVFRNGYRTQEELLTAIREDPMLTEQAAKADRLRETQARQQFTGGHFDEPNVLAHVRFNERTDAEGKRVLFIEEVQSDWAQKGRREGFRQSTEAQQREMAALQEQAKTRTMTPDETSRYMTLRHEIQQARDYAVPEGPFVGKTEAWSELAMKRMIRWAAENGFDRVAWTTGAQQVKRYPEALRQVADKITWTNAADNGDKFVRVWKDGNVVFKGTLKPDSTFADYEAAGKNVYDVLGKGMAERVINENGGEIKGEEFTVGGKGMEGFYDQILPQVAGKLGKKFGARVGETQIGGSLRTADDLPDGYRLDDKGPGNRAGDRFHVRDPQGRSVASSNTAEMALSNYFGRSELPLGVMVEGEMTGKLPPGRGFQRVHSLDITPEMRASVTTEGQPRFVTEKHTGRPATPTHLTHETVQRALPGLDVIDTGDGTYRVYLKDGRVLHVNEVGELTVTPSTEAAFAKSAEAGGLQRPRPVGTYQRIGRDSIIRIAKAARDVQGVADHEGFHFFFDLALTDKEKASLLKHFGNEEAAAYAYARWEPAKQVNSWFSKILAYAKRIYHSFAPTWESTFAGVREGRVGERVAAERGRAEALVPAGERFATEPAPERPEPPTERLFPTPPASEFAEASRILIESMRPKLPRTAPEEAPAAFARGGPGIEGRPGGKEGVPREVAPDIGLNLDKLSDWDPDLKGRVSEVMQEINSKLKRSTTQHWDDVDPAVDRIFKTTSPEELVVRLSRRGGIPAQAELKAMRIGAEAFWRDADGAYEKWQADPANRIPEAEYVKRNLHATAFEMYVTDQKTAAGRLLQSLKESIPSGKDAAEFDIGRLTRSLRKRGVSEADAAALVRIYRESPSQFASALKLAFEPNWRDKLMYAYRAHLLSGAPTTWANGLGNTGSIFANVLETAASGAIESLESAVARKVPRHERQRFASDATAQARAIASALPTATKKLWRDLRDITPGFMPEGGQKKSRWSIREEPVEMEKVLEHKAGPTGHGPISRVYWRAAGRSYQKLKVWDDFFGDIIAAGEWAKLANREARRQGHQGQAATDYASRWLQDNKRTSSYAEMVGKEVDRQLYRLELTKDRGAIVGLGGLAQDATRRFPLLQTVLPFIRTPTNILDMTLRFTPKGLIAEPLKWAKNEGRLRELDAKKRTMDREEYFEQRDKLIAARGEMLDRAGASLAGTAFFIPAFYALANAGLLTGSGPKDARERQLKMATGWRPYSLKIGDTYLPLNRIEPIGTLLGYTADLAEMRAGTKEGGTSFANIVGMFAENAKDKPFMVGLSNIVDFYQSPSKFFNRFATRTLGAAIPTGIAKAAQAYDPIIRDTSADTVLEEIGNTLLSRVPGASTTLPARLTATGKEAHRGGEGVVGAASRLLSPVQYAREEEDTDIEQEMLRVGYVPSLPRRELRLPGGQRLQLGARDYRVLLGSYDEAAKEVAQLMDTAAYRSLPDTVAQGGSRSKEGMIKRIYDKYRDEARMSLYQQMLKRRALPRAGEAVPEAVP